MDQKVQKMNKRIINSENAYAAIGGYAQAIEVSNFSRLVYVSGQVPVTVKGETPTDFRQQAMLVWKNIECQLEVVGLTLSDIVKHTTYLSDRRYRDLNSEVRREVLGDHKAALTVIITDVYDESWLLEVEVIAAV